MRELALYLNEATGEKELHNLRCYCTHLYTASVKPRNTRNLVLLGHFPNEAEAEKVYEVNNEAGTVIKACVPSYLRIGASHE